MLTIHAAKQLRDFELDVSLSVGPGETLVLIGENGAGKSTVLNLASGLLVPDHGEIALAGRVLYSDRLRLDVPVEDRNIGHLFQSYALFPHLSVFENVAFGLRCRKVPAGEIAARVAGELERMHLSDLAGVNVGRLSGGQRQRVALARALAVKPGLLLLDEPLAAVDVRAQGEMRRELRETIRAADIPCILVTRALRDALELGDRTCVMEEGRVVLEGTPEEVLASGENEFIAEFSCGCRRYRE